MRARGERRERRVERSDNKPLPRAGVGEIPGAEGIASEQRQVALRVDQDDREVAADSVEEALAERPIALQQVADRIDRVGT